MSREPQAPLEFRDQLRGWFVEQVSVTDPEAPVASPPSATIEMTSVVRTRGGWRYLGVSVAIVVAVLAGLVVLTDRHVEHVPLVVPPPPAPVDVGSLMTTACADLRDVVERLPLGATAADVERITAGAVAALDRTDALLSGVPGDASVDEIRDLVSELRSRVADLASVAATADRGTFDQTVAGVDLLVLAVGRRMEQAGGAGCVDLPTLRERR